jgi:hypothetical protein
VSVDPLNPGDTLGGSLKKAADHFRELAERMHKLHQEAVAVEKHHENQVGELEADLHAAMSDADFAREESQRLKGMLVEFEDVKRGILDFDEVLSKYSELT